MLFVIKIVAFVLSTVCPFIYALAMHIVVEPIALIRSLIIPSVLSITADFVHIPVSFVSALIGPLIDAIAIFHTVCIISNVLGAIDPLFLAMALLDIIPKLSLIPGSIDVNVLTIAICHVVLELALVNIAFGMPEGAIAFSLVEGPLSLIVRTICPVLHTITMPYNCRRLTITFKPPSMRTFLILLICHRFITLRTLNVLNTIAFGRESVLQRTTLDTISTARTVPTTLHPHPYILIDLLHLPPIHRVVLVHKLVHVLQSWLRRKVRQQLLVRLHHDLVVRSHRVAHRRCSV